MTYISYEGRKDAWITELNAGGRMPSYSFDQQLSQLASKQLWILEELSRGP